uniref:Uncharacterized protein n=1 Tax=Romanomermis culicivorax TaxID=13658 RepID=A0A915JCR2_ROMCU
MQPIAVGGGGCRQAIIAGGRLRSRRRLWRRASVEKIVVGKNAAGATANRRRRFITRIGRTDVLSVSSAGGRRRRKIGRRRILKKRRRTEIFAPIYLANREKTTYCNNGGRVGLARLERRGDWLLRLLPIIVRTIITVGDRFVTNFTKTRNSAHSAHYGEAFQEKQTTVKNAKTGDVISGKTIHDYTGRGADVRTIGSCRTTSPYDADASADTFGFGDERLFLGVGHFAPAGAQNFANFGVMDFGLLFANFFAFRLRPDHKRIHRAFYVRA